MKNSIHTHMTNHHLSSTDANSRACRPQLFAMRARRLGALLLALAGFAVPSGQAASMVYTHLHSFGFPESSGGRPMDLIQGCDGALYGGTLAGGRENQGTVFKANPDGSGYTVLHSFTGGSLHYSVGPSALIQGADGALYGTTKYDVVVPSDYSGTLVSGLL